jgi:hypothetical protein
MSELTPTFDVRTATPYIARVEGSLHHSYRDVHGSICLVCIGRSPNGGVPVNEAALEWLRKQPGYRFVRLQNPTSGFDVIVEIPRLPKKPIRDGKLGPYTYYDPEDFGAPPPFPMPVGDHAPM